MNNEKDETYQAGLAEGRRIERLAIVRWLRVRSVSVEEEIVVDGEIQGFGVTSAADRIENGEHGSSR